MATNAETLVDCSPCFRIFKNGTLDRMAGTDIVPAGDDPSIGVTSKDVTIDPETNLSARIFLPSNSIPTKSKLPILLYFHGGAFLLESAFNPGYHTYLSSLVSSCHVIAVSVEYRLAPEHPVPTVYNDSLIAVKWVLSRQDSWLSEHGNYEKIFLAGDSAGGNIVHYLTVRNTMPEIEGTILFHPWFQGSEDLSDDESYIKTKMLTGKVWKYVCPETDGMDDPRINPMANNAPSLNELNCKRMMVCLAEKDGLKAWQKAYYEAVKKSGWGGKLEFYESREEEHCFHILKPGCLKANELMNIVATFFAN